MKLRALIGAHAGEIRDYSPTAARGALSTGMAEPLYVERRATDVPVLIARVGPEKSKAPQPARRKG